jgi:hypothetical protein
LRMKSDYLMFDIVSELEHAPLTHSHPHTYIGVPSAACKIKQSRLKPRQYSPESVSPHHKIEEPPPYPVPDPYLPTGPICQRRWVSESTSPSTPQKHEFSDHDSPRKENHFSPSSFSCPTLAKPLSNSASLS